MNIKQTITVGVTLATLAGAVFLPAMAMAQTKCGDVETSIIGGEMCNGVDNKDINKSAIIVILSYVIKVLSLGVGVAATGGIVYAAILYASAEDSQEQVKKAKDTIRHVVIGLILYGVMFLLLNYLIPGGVI